MKVEPRTSGAIELLVSTRLRALLRETLCLFMETKISFFNLELGFYFYLAAKPSHELILFYLLTSRQYIYVIRLAISPYLVLIFTCQNSRTKYRLIANLITYIIANCLLESISF